MIARSDICIGIDMGGTILEAITVELTEGTYREIARERIPTRAELGYQALINRVIMGTGVGGGVVINGAAMLQNQVAAP